MELDVVVGRGGDFDNVEGSGVELDVVGGSGVEPNCKFPSSHTRHQLYCRSRARFILIPFAPFTGPGTIGEDLFRRLLFLETNMLFL